MTTIVEDCKINMYIFSKWGRNMMKFKKIMCLFFAMIFILSTLVIQVSAKEEKTSVRNRKLVSVVFDDSGSMENEKWEYTSYAMQCFAAMLNKEDTLDITYMSSFDKGSFSVDTANRAMSVKQIREHAQSGGTPVESIDAAFKTLQNNNDKNVNTQYWLIVITDGQMSGDEPAEDKINRIAETKMPNGTKPQIVYMTICDVNNSFTPSFLKSNIKCERVLTADAVVNAISGIACDISGRYAVAEEDITFVDDKTVKVRADVPLTYLGVLSQRSNATVSQIAGSEGQLLNIESDVHVELPNKYSQSMTDEDKGALRGNVSLFNADSGNIAPDTYTITFTEKISKEDLVIMFEPAFELRIEVFNNDSVVEDLSTLAVEQTVDIKASIYEIGTNNKILSSMLPSGVIEQISLSEDGNIMLGESDLLLEDVVLKAAETEVTASVEIPGFFTIHDTIRFIPVSVELSDMIASVYYDGSERRKNKDGTEDAENVVYITELDTNETGVKFTLFIDGKPIDKTKALALKDAFAKGLKVDFDNYKVFVCDDGGIVVAPTSTKVPTLIYWLSHRGDSTIEANFGEKTASDTICFKAGLKDILPDIFGIVIFLYLIYWIFGKPHFKQRGTIKMFSANRTYGEYVQDYGKTKNINWLAASGLLNFVGPFGMKKKVGNFYVRAQKGGYELIGVNGKYVSTSITYPSATTGISASKQNICRFASSVYVYDGTNYYKISISQ